MKDFETGDQVEVKLSRSSAWRRATYIANRPDNGEHIVSMNDGVLVYAGTGDIHCCHVNHNDNIRYSSICYKRSMTHCCCKCPKY